MPITNPNLNKTVESNESGFTSVSALLVCAALSLVCAGIISLSYMGKRQAHTLWVKVRREEALNSAIMRFATDVLSSNKQDTIEKQMMIEQGGKRTLVTVRAQSETMKFPLTKIADLSQEALASRSSLDLDEVKRALGSGQSLRTDCLRSLFSPYGMADVKLAKLRLNSVILGSSSKEGQVWRITAIGGGHVLDERVRFLGDTNRVYALLSRETYSLAERPTCTQLIEN